MFAIIRTSLNIKMEGALDEANAELRTILKKMWKRSASDKVLLNLHILNLVDIRCEQDIHVIIYCNHNLSTGDHSRCWISFYLHLGKELKMK